MSNTTTVVPGNNNNNNNIEHPLHVLPTDDLVRFAQSLCADDVKATAFLKLLEAYVLKKRGATLRMLDVTGQKMRAIPPEQSFQATELQRWGITLADIRKDLLQGETLQPLVTAHIVNTIGDWKALGIVDFGDLILRVAKPNLLYKWYGERDWIPFVTSLWQSDVMPWNGDVWLAHAEALGKRDLQVLGIALSKWFDDFPELFEAAQGTAHAWLGIMTPPQWLKYAGLTKKHYTELLGPAKKGAPVAATPGTGKSKPAFVDW